MVPCHSLFFEYPSLGAFIVFALPPGRQVPSIKQIKTKTPLRRQWCLIVIED
ncbi:hypothetical protein HMPREF1621_05258 [Escherichia coli A25922R]|nr:hypothetical protein HMPREF1593_05195 [Escherichia coli 907391]ESD30925.1 hypothetical protein HMPREF1603_05236 [Escherichia coli 907892]ESE26034.1 hypothetical protein HMPREF1621_05258 [Escherichia coli A25922R]KXG90228.1 hypothetical protein HMPREF3041_04676 [Escherichia coli]